MVVDLSRWMGFVLIFSMIACGEASQNKPSGDLPKEDMENTVFVPEFSADSAYQWVQQQVEFGPRVPGTESHVACGDWLISQLSLWADTVYVQSATVKAYNGNLLPIRNIIGSFRPDLSNRILLCAHWDTRPYADYDQDQRRWTEPISGANDGGSGVAVLLEIARLLDEFPIDLGIDIIFFDAEDYGQPEFSSLPYMQDSYCLGSQYWGVNPHVTGYQAKYGILLDMVGAKNSRFFLEGHSMQVAPTLMKNMWGIAHNLGFGSYFIFEKTGAIVDDHYYIHKLRGIPVIDIIAQENGTSTRFHPSWHTHDDNMDVIDSKVMQAVGQTVLTVIYKDNAGRFRAL